jgi:hypothetical protein
MNEEFRKLYSPPNIIRTSRRRCAEHVARMGPSGMYIGFWWESQNERYH